MDIQAKLAALRAKKKEEEDAKANASSVPVNTNVSVSTISQQPNESASVPSRVIAPGNTAVANIQEIAASAPSLQASLFTDAASRTQDIDHLEFLGKMNALQEAIHGQHPTMPTLLFQIHTHLKKDPELVTLLNEEAIGVVVKGLEIQTKTELIATVVKQSKAKDKKTALSADMF